MPYTRVLVTHVAVAHGLDLYDVALTKVGLLTYP